MPPCSALLGCIIGPWPALLHAVSCLPLQCFGMDRCSSARNLPIVQYFEALVLSQVGAKDKKAAAQAYEYVFEDQIDFITDMALAGDVVRAHAD